MSSSHPDAGDRGTRGQIQWAGPYCHALDREDTRLAWDPVGTAHAGARRTPAPAGAARFVVRWRVTGFAHPRKRTLTDADAAEQFARRIVAAKLLGSPCDARGWPADAVTGAPQSAPVGAAGSPTDASPAAGPAAAAQPDRLAAAGQPPTGARATAVATAGAGLGRDVAGYIDDLIREFQPYWEQINSARWWLDQLAFVKAVFCYPADDPRIATHGVAAGDSKHFSLLATADFSRALQLRRATNLRVAHQNRQKQQRYQRQLDRYQASLAAWDQGTGPRGRKPVPPAQPELKECYSETQVLVSANAEKAFRTTLSFVFDRAFDAGLFPPGPNLYRQWNPKGSGGRGGHRRSPFRKPERHAADSRDFPGLGFFADLGDALAARGDQVSSGLHTGERYRILPLTLTQLATRPGEGRRLRADDLDTATGIALIVPEPDGALKAREPGQTRSVPLSRLVADLVQRHVEAGLAGTDGTLFTSPEGCALDTGNFYEDFLRPAVASLCGSGRLWDAYPALQQAELYALRKAGISTWVAYGADTFEGCRWSGHTEEELLRSYRGVIAGRGRRTVWGGMDATVEQALRDDPPRGDGPLARSIRAWLQP